MQIASEFLRQFIRDEAEYEVFGTSRRGLSSIDAKFPYFSRFFPNRSPAL